MDGVADRPPFVDQIWQALLRLVLVLIALRVALSLISPILPILILLAAFAFLAGLLLSRHR
jgi:hypothetical protein